MASLTIVTPMTIVNGLLSGPIKSILQAITRDASLEGKPAQVTLCSQPLDGFLGPAGHSAHCLAEASALPLTPQLQVQMPWKTRQAPSPVHGQEGTAPADCCQVGM